MWADWIEMVLGRAGFPGKRVRAARLGAGQDGGPFLAEGRLLLGHAVSRRGVAWTARRSFERLERARQPANWVATVLDVTADS